MRKNILLLLTGILILVSYELTHAATTIDSTFHAHVNVTDSCSFPPQNDALAFGQYDPNNGTDGIGKIVVNCTDKTKYKIGIDWGEHGAPEKRNMVDKKTGKAQLSYNIYSDAKHKKIWPSIDEAKKNYKGTGQDQTYTLYGLIAPGQQPKQEGVYTDMLSITLAID
jgi:spore coat protein U-like protein